MEEHIDDFASAMSPCYDLYVALHSSKRSHPGIFTDSLSNRILTAIMGGHSRGWRVVGITRNALQHYVESNFKHRSGNGIQRGHVVPRIQTTKSVMATESPLPLKELARLWFDVDATVLCARGENKAIFTDDYIRFENPRGDLFPGLPIGWRHEEEFLRSLASSNGVCR